MYEFYSLKLRPYYVRTMRPTGILASLDVDSLFTNVPVTATIEIICNNVYHHPSIPPPAITKPMLVKLLNACTTECPFTHIDGSLYVQLDGVAMGSPLGVTFANFYMCDLENKILDNNPQLKPPIYCRYIDDIFVVTHDMTQLQALKTALQNNSVLTFTHEIGHNNINFLDINVDTSTAHSTTKTFIKPTNSGIYLNFKSECPQKYKDSTVQSMIHRTYKNASNYKIFHQQVIQLKQAFINNAYPNRCFDKIL